MGMLALLCAVYCCIWNPFEKPLGQYQPRLSLDWEGPPPPPPPNTFRAVRDYGNKARGAARSIAARARMAAMMQGIKPEGGRSTVAAGLTAIGAKLEQATPRGQQDAPCASARKDVPTPSNPGFLHPVKLGTNSTPSPDRRLPPTPLLPVGWSGRADDRTVDRTVGKTVDRASNGNGNDLSYRVPVQDKDHLTLQLSGRAAQVRQQVRGIVDPTLKAGPEHRGANLRRPALRNARQARKNSAGAGAVML